MNVAEPHVPGSFVKHCISSYARTRELKSYIVDIRVPNKRVNSTDGPSKSKIQVPIKTQPHLMQYLRTDAYFSDAEGIGR